MCLRCVPERVGRDDAGTAGLEGLDSVADSSDDAGAVTPRDRREVELAVLQTTIDETPDAVSVQVDAIQQFPSARVNPETTLSERQQEALDVALDLGYYDSPRSATHEDVAAELGCAPNTATEHLQKGEAKLVRAGMDVFDSKL